MKWQWHFSDYIPSCKYFSDVKSSSHLAKRSKIRSRLGQAKGDFLLQLSPTAAHYLEQINGNYDGVLPSEVIDTNDHEKNFASNVFKQQNKLWTIYFLGYKRLDDMRRSELVIT